MNSKATQCICALILLGVIAIQNTAFGLTGELADCYGACSKPNSTQATSACNGIGCSGSWVWVSPEDVSIQRCTYTKSFPPGSHGAYTKGNQNNSIICSACTDNQQQTCNGNQSTKVTGTDTITVTGGYSTSVQKEANLGLKGALDVGVTVSSEFSVGGSYSSSEAVESSAGSSATITIPGCGKKQLFGVAFAAPINGTGTFTFTYEGKCSGCSSSWISVKTCSPQTVKIISGEATAFKWTVCQRECTNVPNDVCQSSSTVETVSSNPVQCDHYDYP